MRTKNIKLLFIVLLSVSVLSSCLKDDDNLNDMPVASLTLVNSYSPSAYILHMVDNSYLTSPYRPFAYNTFIGHPPKYLFTGNRRLKTVSYENKVLIDSVYTFKDSTAYTSFVYGTPENAYQIITEDKVIKDLGDKTGLRFLHLANNTPKVNVYLKDLNNPIFTDRAFETQLTGETLKHAEFMAQASGNQKIIITDESKTVLAEREYNFEKGRYYSIILSGNKDADQQPLYLGIIPQ